MEVCKERLQQGEFRRGRALELREDLSGQSAGREDCNLPELRKLEHHIDCRCWLPERLVYLSECRKPKMKRGRTILVLLS